MKKANSVDDGSINLDKLIRGVIEELLKSDWTCQTEFIRSPFYMLTIAYVQPQFDLVESKFFKIFDNARKCTNALEKAIEMKKGDDKIVIPMVYNQRVKDVLKQTAFVTSMNKDGKY